MNTIHLLRPRQTIITHPLTPQNYNQFFNHNAYLKHVKTLKRINKMHLNNVRTLIEQLYQNLKYY